ncbi:MAG: TonB-dependent receptor [Bacteroidota bacterium]
MSKLYLCLICIAISFSCLGQSILSKKISAQYQDRPLIEVLDDLNSKHRLNLYFKREWIPDQNVTISLDSTSVDEVINQALKDSGLAYLSYNDYAIVIARESDLKKQFSQDYFTLRRTQKEEAETVVSVDNVVTIGKLSNDGTVRDATLTGRVSVDGKDEPLVGVVVYIEKLNLSTTTDVDGNYRLKVPAGNHVIEARILGFDPKTQYIRVNGNGRFDIAMAEEAIELDEIVVSGVADDNNVSSVQIGVERLSPIKIKEIPSFLGEADVVRSILTLPGVSTVGEGATGFNVRGGSIDQNLVMQDGALVFNSSHALGFFSVFNPDIIKNVTLYKGNIPAQYGGRLSSVLEVETRDGDYRKVKGQGGVGPVSSRFTLEGPLVKDKLSFMVAGRSSYSDWIVRRFPDFRESSVFFYDANAKLSYRLSDNASLSGSYYRSFDRFKFTNRFGFSWSTTTANASFLKVVNPQLTLSSLVSYGEIDNSSFDTESVDAFELNNGLEYLKFRQDFYLSYFENHSIIVGAELINYEGQPEIIRPDGDRSSIIPEEVSKDRGRELAFYINDEIEVNDKISLSVGLRYSRFQNLGADEVFVYQPGVERSVNNIIDTLSFSDGDVIETFDGWEPRVSFKYSINSTSSIKASYNRINQYIHLISNTAAAVPNDLWQVSNPHIPSQKANNFSLGYFENFKYNVWESGVEVFYKSIEDVVEYRDLADLILNPALETELLNGTGTSYGAELSINKKKGKLNGAFSYTYARRFNQIMETATQESINRGQRFPANFDKPHTVNCNINIKLKKQSTIAFNFTYSTGRPVTAPTSNYFLGNVVVPNFSDRNEFRIPDYHRLDLAYTFSRSKIKKQRYQSSFTFSIYNLYGRDNAFSVFFQRDIESISNAFKLTVLGSPFPAITYNFSF